MPTYEYRCADCDNHYEKREGFEAPAKQPCPRCGGRAKRVIYAPPIVFKGSGFYVTDSRKNGDTATVGGAGDFTPASTDSTSTAADSSPAPSSSPAPAASAD